MASKSNGDIYKLINDLRLEVKGDISTLSRTIEGIANDVNDMKIKDATLSTRVYMIVGIIGTVTSGVIYAIANKLFKVGP